MSLQASVDFDSENEALHAELAAAFAAALEEKDRELAELRAQLAQVQHPGPPALTVLAGKAERP